MGSRGTSRGQVQMILGTKWWRREGRSPDDTVVVGKVSVRVDRIGWDHVGIVWWGRPSLRTGRRVKGVPGKMSFVIRSSKVATCGSCAG